MVGLGIVGLVSGCGGQSEEAAEPPALPQASPDPVAFATIGPIRFEYDTAELTLAELPIDLPPDYATQAWAVKLIPVERAAQLGQVRCTYGQPGPVRLCVAEAEPGLVMALLERPLGEYRDDFTQARLGDAITPTQLNGQTGFSFTAESNGTGIEYRYIPVEERTLLVARQFAPGHPARSPAMEDVIRSIAAGLADLPG
ncbi:MAG: hypothetical protein H5U21_00285 [Porphyrobacter sp.]|nr:hypothetical protein [Porphyrobacter sp.]